jgi:hypothetical protein
MKQADSPKDFIVFMFLFLFVTQIYLENGPLISQNWPRRT